MRGTSGRDDEARETVFDCSTVCILIGPHALLRRSFSLWVQTSSITLAEAVRKLTNPATYKDCCCNMSLSFTVVYRS